VGSSRVKDLRQSAVQSRFLLNVFFLRVSVPPCKID
jgi:hypothetical protein